MVCGLAACLCGSRARADDRPPLLVDWQRLSEMFRTGGGILAPEASALRISSHGGAGHASFETDRTDLAVDGLGGASRLTSGAPDASLVAHDWGGPRLFVGHLSPVDQMRLSRSSRMLVGRIRVPLARVVPFVQLGLGQWRIDPELLPYRNDAAYAAQLGYGFEVMVSPHATVVFEADSTFLYRDRDPRCVQARPPAMWGSFVAARARF
jgi:hypothetical protein